MGITFGLCVASGDPTPTARRLAAWKDLGISRVRFVFDGSVVFANGQVNADSSVDVKPDYAPVDTLVIALRAAGIEINWNLQWLPKWLSGGIPAYQRYETGWWDLIVNPVTHASTGIRYNHPGIDPPHVNPNAIRALATAMAARWGTSGDTWAFGNEPGGGYWPPSQGDAASIAAAADRFVDEGAVPFAEGVRDVLPDARMVGPEADDADMLRRVLQCAEDRGVACYDEITIHPYGDPAKWPGDSYRLMADFWRVMTPGLRAGRRVNISEINGPGGPGGPGGASGVSIDLWIDHVLRMLERDADYATLYDFSAIMLLNDAPYFNVDDSLTDLGARVKAIIAKAS